jgi:gliding motility-associated-like protein
LGKIYFTGTFSCTQTEYSAQLGEGLFNSVGYQDIWLTAYSITGQRLWMRQFGGQFQDEVYAVHSNGGSSPIIAGSYSQRFLVPANNSFVYTQANTDSTIQHPNNLHPYCNDAHYGEFISVHSFGNKDIMVTKPFDINRAVYDYYIREDSSCTFPIVPPHIIATSDTISACNAAEVYIQLGTGLNWQAGPIFSYASATSVIQSGMYHFTISQIDGCRSFTDSIYVSIHPSPSQTSIYSTYGAIKTAIPEMGCWEKLTKLYGDTAQLIGNLSDPQNTSEWLDPNGNPTSGTQIPAFDDGIYTFIETNSFGCSASKCVRVFSYTIISQSGIPCSPGDSAVSASELGLLFNNVLADTIHICDGENITLQLVDSLNSFAPALSPAFIYWELSSNANFIPGNIGGPYTFYDHTNKVKMDSSGLLQVKLSLLLPPFNIDTILQLEREVYVNIHPNPDFALSITSTTNGICPGDTTTLLITAPRPFSLEGNFFGLSSDSTFCLAVQPGIYNLHADFIDPITGCGNSKFDSYQLKVKDAPIVHLNPSSGIKCPADSVTLIADAGSWVSWFGPQGNEIANSSLINVNPPGNYYYILTDFTNCTLLSNTVEVKDLSSPEILTSPGSICNGNPAYVTLTSDPLIQYNWLPPLSGSDTLQMVYEPGTYMVEATFCNATNTFSIEVEITGLQAEIAFSTDSVLCTQRDLLLVANPGMLEYSWQNGAFQTPDYLASDSGWVYLSIKDTFGCTSKDSLYVEEFVSPLPPDSLFTIPSCPGTIATAIAVSDLPILWYDDLDHDSFASGDTLYYSIDSTDTFIYASTVDTSTSCTSARIQAEWILKSNVLFPNVLDSLELCGGDVIDLNMTQIVGLEGGSWLGPNGFSSSNLNASIAMADSSMEGSYFFYPMGDEFHCVVDTPQVVVNVFLVPTPQITFPATICEHQSLYVEPVLQENITYYWSKPNGSISFNSFLSIDDLQLNQAGNYTLSSTLLQCSRTDQFHLSVVHGPKLNPPFSMSSPNCVGDTIFVVNLNPSSLIGMTVNWYNTQAFQPLNDNTLFLANAQTSNSGDFSVQVELNGCLSNMKVFELVVQEKPVSNLYDTYPFCEGSELTIQGPPDMYEYHWSTGESSQLAHVSEEGMIVLRIVDAHGCSVIDSTFADALYCDVDKTPNTFSPNDDGINDKLIFKVEGGVIHVATIFDRQGRNIRTLTSPNIDWDGKNELGERVIPATYFYVLQVGMLNGEIKSQDGFITVFE